MGSCLGLTISQEKSEMAEKLDGEDRVEYFDD